MILPRRTAVNFVVNFWIKCSTVGHLDKQHSTTQSTGKKILTNTNQNGDSFSSGATTEVILRSSAMTGGNTK